MVKDIRSTKKIRGDGLSITIEHSEFLYEREIEYTEGTITIKVTQKPTTVYAEEESDETTPTP